MQKPTATGAAPNIRTGDRLTTTTAVDLCACCTLWLANDDATGCTCDEPHDRAPMTDGLWTLNGEHDDFSAVPCDGCRTYLAGERFGAVVTDEPQTTVADCCATCAEFLAENRRDGLPAAESDHWALVDGTAPSGDDDTCGWCGDWLLDESDRPDGMTGVAAGAAVAVIRRIGGGL